MFFQHLLYIRKRVWCQRARAVRGTRPSI
jgi:hypothetical protein